MLRDSRKIAAILAADVVDYSRLMSADEELALAALQKCRAIFEEQVREFNGHEFGSVGDSLMAEFGSAVNAVECALALQERIGSVNASTTAAERMQLRAGVNLGDVIEQGGSAFGDAVNVAARLQSLAKPGGVMISGPVYDQVHLKIRARFIDTGLRQVKNIQEPVRTFEVLPAAPAGIGGRIATAVASVTSRRVLRATAVAAGLVLALVLGLLWRELPVSVTGERLGTLLDSQFAEPMPNSIAVLPFVNLTGDPGNDYLGDGLAEELLHRLKRVPELNVAARTSAFAFKGKELGVSAIAGQLGVGYIVEGSIRRQADRIRVNAALVEGSSGSTRWSDSYESVSADIFAVESDIAAKVIAELEHVLGRGATPLGPEPHSGSGVAYDFYLQGLAYLRQPASARTLDAAEQLFTRSLAEQPDFARAQAGLCEARVERYILDKVPAHVRAAEEACVNAQALDSAAHEVQMAVGRLRLATGNASEATAAYRHALELVPRSPDALIGLARALAADGKRDEAERTFGSAIAAQPSYAATYVAFGNFLLGLGRAEDAAEYYERGSILAPDNPTALSNLGGAYLLTGNFEKASDAFRRSLALEPRRGSYANLGTVEYYLGRFQEAGDMFRKAVDLAPADHRLWGNLADALFYGSRTDEALTAYRRALELADGELAINPRHAVNQAVAAYYATRLDDKNRARRGVTIALSEGEDDVYVQYYVALTELGLGDLAAAVAHARRARELGYPESLMRAAPELGDIRKSL